MANVGHLVGPMWATNVGPTLFCPWTNGGADVGWPTWALHGHEMGPMWASQYGILVGHVSQVMSVFNSHVIGKNRPDHNYFESRYQLCNMYIPASNARMGPTHVL